MTNIETIRAALLGIVSKTEREEALKALEEVAREVEWQNIETAPRDGTEIIILVNGDHYHEYDDTKHSFIDVVKPAFFHSGAFITSDGWVFTEDENLVQKWKPLPTPPKEQP